MTHLQTIQENDIKSFEEILNKAELIKQGAEAKLYKLKLYDQSQEFVLLKYRFKKTYRHSILDQQLTKQRLTFEARSLSRAIKSFISVPILKALDLNRNWLILEWIDGLSLRDWIDSSPDQIQLSQVLSDVGITLAKLHLADIIHGDLTTSNMMLRPISPTHDSPPTLEVVLIDFGLSSVGSLIEDKAVDLYVLQRAFLSTHPDRSTTPTLKHTSTMFDTILASYAAHLPPQDWANIKSRLQNVRMRGRKRSMVG